MILIAITLIAAVAIAGFVFNLFGTFTTSATVSANAQFCQIVSGNEVCTFSLINTSTSSTGTLSYCSLVFNGIRYQGAIGNGGTIDPGTPLTGVTCTVTGHTAVTGLQINGEVPLINGATVFFIITG